MTLAIRSDLESATELLQRIARLCAAHGATWHPKLEVEVEQGAMRLVAPQDTRGPLIVLPTELLTPIATAEWSDTPNELQLLQAPASATPVQVELLHLHAALYNATDKMRWWSTRHPARLVETSPELAAILEPLKPGHGAKGARSPAESFLATRSFSWTSEQSQAPRQPVLLPIVDLLNHHHLGAPLRIRDGAMRITAAQTGGRECFAHYGHRRDVLDLALHYGHCDLSTPFAHSAPLAITVAGLGRIKVEHQNRQAPLHRFDPPRVTIEADGLRLSHLCCHLDHPERIRTLLRLALQGSLRRRGHDAAEASRLAERGLQDLGAANIRLLGHLEAVAELSTHPGGATLAAAARRQAAITAAVLGT